MRLTSKEVETLEALRRAGDGVFVVTRAGGDFRQVSRRLKKDVDAGRSDAVTFHPSEPREQRAPLVIFTTQLED